MLAGQGETKQASISDFKIDKVGPTITTVSFKKADNTAYTPGTWSTQNLVQTLSGNDNGGSGVSYFQYSENSGTATNTASGESWSADRNSKVKFRAVDALGNAGAWTSEYNLMIDKTPPSITSVTGVPYSAWVKSRTIGLAGSDNLSGVRTYQYSADGGAWTNCGTSLPWSAGAGEVDFMFRCIDNAGNTSAVLAGGYYLLIDNIVPVIYGGSAYSNSSSHLVTVIYNIEDSLSGIDTSYTRQETIALWNSGSVVKSNVTTSQAWTAFSSKGGQIKYSRTFSKSNYTGRKES